MKKIISIILLILVSIAGFVVYRFSIKYFYECKTLKQIIERLQADSRIAEVVVTGIKHDEQTGKTYTTIKFLEYGVQGEALEPKYFTFSGNIIQFQSLVIRFNDIHIKQADKLRGKSAYLFWKVFTLDGKDTQEYEITKIYSVPQGYRVAGNRPEFEERLWSLFWNYALDPHTTGRVGVKNAQIEAPGTKFIPGRIYTIKIEHDAGMRIDTERIPEILKGETIISD